ncbi:MAG: thermonuclease family protein [Elusimicrobia bacterium]|nr:thermonuclease family protein [Elusimicrobiota bacterium]
MFVSRAVLPFFWMFIGGAIVYFWKPRSPRPEKPEPATVRNMTLDQTSEALRFAHPETLPQAPVLRVVDGDTAEILWKNKPVFLRYYGVNTTERGTACYEEATDRNRALSEGSVRLAFDERQKDAHHRILAYVFTEEGVSIDAQLVSEGLGKAWKRDGALKDRLMDLEDAARREKRGCLWSENQPDSKPAPRRKRRRS